MTQTRRILLLAHHLTSTKFKTMTPTVSAPQDAGSTPAWSNDLWRKSCWNGDGSADKFAFFDGVTGAPGLQLLKQAGLVLPPDSICKDAEYTLSKNVSGKLQVLDSACGTGVLTRLLLENATPDLRERGVDVLAGDISENMVKRAEEHFKKEEYSKVRARVLDSMVRWYSELAERIRADSVALYLTMQKSDLPDESFDVYMLNFGYMLMPDPDQALAGA